MPESYQPEHLPEHLSPQECGAHMAALRAKFGLTPQEVSERLHIRTRYIHAIETGQLDQMPGKVYARGYVHSYAEFLGLDADDTVARCFAGDTVTPVAAAIPLKSGPQVVTPSKLTRVNWQRYGVMAAVVLVVALVISQLTSRSNSEDIQEASIAPVPEAMLQSVRNMVMPTPRNFECLTGNSVLACMYADEASARLAEAAEEDARWIGPIDLSDVIVEEAGSRDD